MQNKEVEKFFYEPKQTILQAMSNKCDALLGRKIVSRNTDDLKKDKV